MIDMILIGLIFVLAGFVKGVAGFGLPTVSVALIALLRPIPEAIGLMLVPAFVTNLWQGLAGGQLRLVAPRIALFLACAVVGTIAAAWHVAAVDGRFLSGLLGLSLLASATLAVRFNTFTGSSTTTRTQKLICALVTCQLAMRHTHSLR